jgi:prepilin peptidase CpaA
MMLAITSTAALAFLIPNVPLALWTIFTDLRSMRISNMTILAMIAAFIVIGPFVLQLDAYLWRFAQFGVVLVIAILLNAIGGFGAGDGKYAAAAALFIDREDAMFVLLLLGVSALMTVVLVEFARRTPLHKLAPDWESWKSKRQYPMGLGLGVTMMIYLALGAFS